VRGVAVYIVVWICLALGPSPALAAESLVVTFAGDVAYPTGWGADARIDRAGAALFAALRPIAATADLGVINLECPVTRRAPSPSLPFPMACAPERVVPAVEAGMNVLSLANNHATDAGYWGLRDTRKHLTALARKRPLWFAGLGDDAEAALTPVTIALPDKPRVAFFSVTGFRLAPQVARLEDPRLEAEVRRAKRNHDIVIVSSHAGVEYDPIPLPRYVDRYRALVDAGADVVAGHHAHVMQGVERYGRGVILYGLGNLSFASAPVGRKLDRREPMLGLVARLRITKRGVLAADLHPFYVDNGRPWTLGRQRLDVAYAAPQALPEPFLTSALDRLIARSRAIPDALPFRAVRRGDHLVLDMRRQRFATALARRRRLRRQAARAATGLRVTRR